MSDSIIITNCITVTIWIAVLMGWWSCAWKVKAISPLLAKTSALIFFWTILWGMILLFT